MIQLLAQWSGANAVTIYAPDFFAIVGVKSHERQLFFTTILGIVKLVASLVCAFILVDRIGRKKTLYAGIVLQILSILYLGVFESVKSIYHLHNASTNRAAMAALAMIYVNACGWAMGWNSAQYLINAEIFPIHLRSVSSGVIMVFHFVSQYGNAKVIPFMFLGLTTWGTLLFFAGITIIGLAFVWFFIPEVSGKSLELIDELFDLPWYQIGGRFKNKNNKYDSEQTAYLENSCRLKYSS
jgi:MFS family permease